MGCHRAHIPSNRPVSAYFFGRAHCHITCTTSSSCKSGRSSWHKLRGHWLSISCGRLRVSCNCWLCYSKSLHHGGLHCTVGCMAIDVYNGTTGCGGGVGGGAGAGSLVFIPC